MKEREGSMIRLAWLEMNSSKLELEDHSMVLVASVDSVLEDLQVDLVDQEEIHLEIFSKNSRNSLGKEDLVAKQGVAQGVPK